MPPSDTYFTVPPEWGWLVVLYFFFGGIAGGSYFIAAFVTLFGGPEDRPLARLAHYVALPAVILCAPLLILDLTRPERFWHMLVQSETYWPMFKWWSPMSVGSWALLIFGAFASVSFTAALVEAGRLRLPWLSWCCAEPFRRAFTAAGALVGFFLAAYTGVLLDVTNRPIWGDSDLIGLLFLVSAASTSAALLMLLSRRDPDVAPASQAWLSRFDGWVMGLELVVLVIFLATLGAVVQAWLNVWGLVLVVGVVVAGIVAPLALHHRPRLLGSATLPAAAALALLGGFLLRVAVVMSSEVV